MSVNCEGFDSPPRAPRVPVSAEGGHEDITALKTDGPSLTAPVVALSVGVLPHVGRGGQTERERHFWQRLVRTSILASLMFVVVVFIGWRVTTCRSRDPHTGTVLGCTYPYFVLCFCGGIVTGLAHLVVTPIDVVKCRIQVGEYGSFSVAFREMFDVECHRQWRKAVPVFFRGWVPTAFGYCSQGAIKFCLYEVLKCAFMSALSSHKHPSAVVQTLLFLTASFVAEMVADLALAPWEALKIKIQTSMQSSQSVRVLLSRICVQEGWRGLYSGLVPLWFRQVPYTMMKFASFEHIASMLRRVWLRLLGRATLGSAMQLFVTVQAGILAGILCALISHPADTVLSKLSTRKADREDEPTQGSAVVYPGDLAERDHISNLSMVGGATAAPTTMVTTTTAAASEASLTAADIVRRLGWRGLWRGVGPRIAMVAAITSLQWLLYDMFKVMVGLPASSAATPPPTRVPTPAQPN